MKPQILFWVFCGGGIGASGRYGLQLILEEPAGSFDTPTFIANVTGAFLLGILQPCAETRPVRRWPRSLAPALGGFTTYSALMVSPILTARSGDVSGSVGYFLLSLAGGFAAAWLGYRITGGPWLKCSPIRSGCLRGLSSAAPVPRFDTRWIRLSLRPGLRKHGRLLLAWLRSPAGPRSSWDVGFGTPSWQQASAVGWTTFYRSWSSGLFRPSAPLGWSIRYRSVTPVQRVHHTPAARLSARHSAASRQHQDGPGITDLVSSLRR